MKNDNYVIFKGTKNGISIYLDDQCDYETLKDSLQKKIEGAAKFFEGVQTPIILKGRELSEEQELELIHLISDKTNMNITFVRDETQNSSHLPSVMLSDCLQQYNITKYYRGAVRSGQIIHFSGSVVIVGDVNPGGEVRAEGNIIILGALKGMAHAGINGMTDAFVAALCMTPVQLRIADIITRFPSVIENQDKKERRNRKKPPIEKKAEFAYVENGKIFVVPLE